MNVTNLAKLSLGTLEISETSDNVCFDVLLVPGVKNVSNIIYYFRVNNCQFTNLDMSQKRVYFVLFSFVRFVWVNLHTVYTSSDVY